MRTCSYCAEPAIIAIYEGDGKSDLVDGKPFIAAACNEHRGKIVLLAIQDQVKRQGLS